MSIKSWEFYLCTLCSYANVSCIEKAIYMVCPLSKCNPRCTALIAAIYVCPFVKSVNANNTCSGAKLYSSPAAGCYCIKVMMIWCVCNRPHNAPYSAVLCVIVV